MEVSYVRVTHGFTAVAELKPRKEVHAAAHHYVTHGFTAVAELKQVDGGLAIGLIPVTHGFTAVAELKQEQLLHGRHGPHP